jgi:hypothetical protein
MTSNNVHVLHGRNSIFLWIERRGTLPEFGSLPSANFFFFLRSLARVCMGVRELKHRSLVHAFVRARLAAGIHMQENRIL